MITQIKIIQKQSQLVTHIQMQTGKSKTVLEPVDGLDEQTRRALTTRHGTRKSRGGRTTQVEVSMNGDIVKASQQQIKQSKEIQD